MKKSLVLLSVLPLLAGCISGSAYVNKIDSKGFNLSSNYKRGQACNYFYLFGTSTIKAAAENGNIKNVKYVEQSANPFIHCYIVYGD